MKLPSAVFNAFSLIEVLINSFYGDVTDTIAADFSFISVACKLVSAAWVVGGRSEKGEWRVMVIGKGKVVRGRGSG